MVDSGEKEPTETVVAEDTETPTGTNANAAAADPSAARKRRKAIIESQRKELEEAAQQQKETENEGSSKTNSKKGNASVSGNSDEGQSMSESEKNNDDDGDQSDGKKRKAKRTQIRYDPDVPMSKEQLAAWRREARRVRNRESAAASRQRIRNRITELETEVDDYKAKYYAALERLKELEQMAQTNQQPKETAGGAAVNEGKSGV